MFRKNLLRFILTFFLLFSFIVLQHNIVTTAAVITELKIGAWPGSQPTQSNITALQSLQQKKLDIVHTFINWSTTFDSIRQCVDATYSNGSILMITWEPWEYDTVKIKNGQADDYIRKMASDIKAFGKVILLRPLHEANGNWYPWAIGDSTVNTNDTYIAAYRHIVDIFRSQGVTNVKWVFNVNCSNCGKGTSFTSHYPGNDYVDYNSIDGYNWGTTQSWGSTWQTFDQIFLSSYNALKQYNKQILIAEWASTETGGDKAKWITDSFNTLRSSYGQIFAEIWFNEKKETNWIIDSTPASLDAYRKAIGGAADIVGDLTGDGTVDAIDYSKLRSYLLGLEPGTNPNMNTWDICKDGEINALDYATLKKYLLGIITTLPYIP